MRSIFKKTAALTVATVAILMSLACVEFDRLEIEPVGFAETEAGVVVEVTVSNVGADQEFLSVEQGLLGIDVNGNAWAASDECSTLDGQTVTEGQPVTGAVCFPFEIADDETGEMLPYIPSGTKIVYIIATDNIFAGDDSKYFVIPVGGTLSLGDTPAPPEEPVAEQLECASSATIQVWLWRSIRNPGNLYLSTRPGDSGPWTTTSALDMSAEHKSAPFNISGVVEVVVPLTEE